MTHITAAVEGPPVEQGNELGNPGRFRHQSGTRIAESLLPARVAIAVLCLAASVALSCALSRGPATRPVEHADGQREPLPASRLQALLDHLVDSEPGVRSGLLLVDGPTFHWKGASGIAFAGSGLPILPDDQFDIDSIAKMMTAAITMMLVEDGTLALDDHISTYLPDSLVQGLHVYKGRSYGEEITVRQVLHHTTGIVDDWACPGFIDLVAEDSSKRWRPEETIEYVKKNCEPRFEPGNGFHYSDTAYNLLGLVLERVTGTPLHRLYREKLLDPLGMDHTYRPAYEPARPSIPGRPPAERYLDEVECGLWTSVMTADWAGGGLVSTTEDLNTFLRSFLRGSMFQDSSMRDTMLTWVESGPHNNYGLGVSRVLFSRFDDPGMAALGEVWGHAGSSHNFMYYWPQEDITIIGTLNQMAVETDLYETVAKIMTAIRATRNSGHDDGASGTGSER
jgi:D-alanyl-D-alanine carboxypeptidase